MHKQSFNTTHRTEPVMAWKRLLMDVQQTDGQMASIGKTYNFPTIIVWLGITINKEKKILNLIKWQIHQKWQFKGNGIASKRGNTVKLIFVYLLKLDLLLREGICSPWGQIVSFKSWPSFRRDLVCSKAKKSQKLRHPPPTPAPLVKRMSLNIYKMHNHILESAYSTISAFIICFYK